ncbi:MAG TPA: TIGR03364 family FAD-dependent oxidoreductase [Gaiellaceae bacterium]|nr:TIGR03364 family FAD-dependent oxidoreductase [Gaiellaceae bacterium]
MTRVVVVGGGVIGAFHAYLALKQGAEVVHLEREFGARGASIRNFGLIWVSGRRPGDELALALRSRQLWEEIGQEIPEVGFRANGSLTILQNAAELAVVEQVLAREDAAERQFSLLDPAEVRAVNPAIRGHVLAGLHCNADAAVEPRQVPSAIRATLDGAPGYEWLPGRHIVEVGNRMVRDHLGEQHEGDLVFLCPGAAHRGFAGWQADHLPLRRVRLQMMETEPFPVEVTTSIADGDSLRYYPAFDVPALAGLPAPAPIVAEQHMQLLLQQRLNGSLTIGDTHEYDEPFEVTVEEGPYRHLQERVESILGAPMPPVRRRWAGVYSQVIDERLFYCEEVADSAWIVTGVGGRGMTAAPAIAERVLAGAGLGQRAVASSTGL